MQADKCCVSYIRPQMSAGCRRSGPVIMRTCQLRWFHRLDVGDRHGLLREWRSRYHDVHQSAAFGFSRRQQLAERANARHGPEYGGHDPCRSAVDTFFGSRIDAKAKPLDEGEARVDTARQDNRFPPRCAASAPLPGDRHAFERHTQRNVAAKPEGACRVLKPKEVRRR